VCELEGITIVVTGVTLYSKFFAQTTRNLLLNFFIYVKRVDCMTICNKVGFVEQKWVHFLKILKNIRE